MTVLTAANQGGVAIQMAEEIAVWVADGTYPIGARLPGERDLAIRFRASRSSVRQALQLLQARGMVDIRGRSGAYVQELSAGHATEALMLLINRAPHAVRVRDLMQVRLMLEIEMAGLSAECRNSQDLRRIAVALADTCSSENATEWAAADVEFHGALAHATGNPLFAVIYDSLRGILLEQRLRTGTALPETRQQSFQYHQRIFDRVAAGDATGARQAMHDHLLEAQETMTRYIKLEAELVSQPGLANPVPPRDG